MQINFSYSKITCTKSTFEKFFETRRLALMIASAWVIGYGLTAMALFGMWGKE